MALNDVVRLKVHGRLLGGEVQTGFHFRFATALATAADLITDWRAAMETMHLALVTADFTIPKYSVEARLPDTAETVEFIVEPAVAGTAAGTPIPPQDALVLSQHTGTKGRRFRGRAYIGGLSEAQTALGRAEAALLANAATFNAQLITIFGPLGSNTDYRLVVFSPEDLTFVKKNGQAAPRVGNLTTQVTTVTTDPVIRSQRRRQIGVGQ